MPHDYRSLSSMAQALARQQGASATDAEDIAQEVCLKLSQMAVAPRNLFGWMQTVIRRERADLATPRAESWDETCHSPDEEIEIEDLIDCRRTIERVAKKGGDAFTRKHLFTSSSAKRMARLRLRRRLRREPL